ncbi:MAG: efflux RND transporter periplasmic adaptor subunit [Pseudomonadota bacterium]
MKSQKKSTKPSLASLTDRSANLRRWLIPAALLISALVLLRPSIYASSQELPAPAEGAAAHPVRVIAAKLAEDPPVVRLPGVLRARERGKLAFLHSGHLAERLVERGQTVEAGEILAVLHNPALMPGADAAAAQAREAKLNLEQLEREVVRLEDLEERNLVPTEELERIVSRRDAAIEARNQADAALGEAREQLDEAFLRAPYSGVISELMIEPGQFVAAGQGVLGLIGSSGLETAVHLPIERAARLEVGRTVRVKSPDTTSEFEGMIREIGASEPGQAVEIVIELDPSNNASLQSGQAVDVTLPLTSDQILAVPMAAITQSSSGVARVFRVENGRALAVDVRPGRLQGGWLEVEGQLAEGDLIVVAGHGRLLDDDPVRVLQ